MPTYRSQFAGIAHYVASGLQTWRAEAFENTITYDEFESYLVVHLEEMIRKQLKLTLFKSASSGAKQQLAFAEIKLMVLRTDNRGWWIAKKLGAIKEARRQQQEE